MDRANKKWNPDSAFERAMHDKGGDTLFNQTARRGELYGLVGVAGEEIVALKRRLEEIEAIATGTKKPRVRVQAQSRKIEADNG